MRGVSNVAASAAWALAAMFHAACPQPPGDAGANADCHIGATGVNFHAAEARRFFASGDGNAYYNPIAYDPTAAHRAPRARPEYYALLLFARFAQGETGLRPLAVRGLDAWQSPAGGGCSSSTGPRIASA